MDWQKLDSAEIRLSGPCSVVEFRLYKLRPNNPRNPTIHPRKSPNRPLAPTEHTDFFQEDERPGCRGVQWLPTGNIPIEQFESLESIRLVGEVATLLHIMRPTGKTSSNTLPVPFLSYLELHSTIDRGDFPFEVLTEILRERKEAGHGVKAVRITGEYRECSSEEISELVKFVDALILDQILDSVEERRGDCALSRANGRMIIHIS